MMHVYLRTICHSDSLFIKCVIGAVMLRINACLTSTSVLVTLGWKCTLAASRAVP